MFLHTNINPKFSLDVPADFSDYQRRWQVLIMTDYKLYPFIPEPSKRLKVCAERQNLLVAFIGRCCQF